MNDLPEKTSTPFGPAERRFVYAVALRITKNADDADDVTQDALLLAHRHLAGFRGDSRFRTWLYRIATTTALGHLRRTRRAKLHVPASELALVAPTKSAETELADAEIDRIVREAVSGLDAPYRDVLLARAEASEVEVAHCLGISVANVKIRAHRARKQLRAVLQHALGPAVGVAA